MIMFHENSATRILYHQKVVQMSGDEAMLYNNNHILDKYGEEFDDDDDIGSNLSSEREAMIDHHHHHHNKPGNHVKKSMSLGTGLDLKAMAAYDGGNDDSDEDESWQRSFDDSKDFDTDEVGHSECSDLVNNDEDSSIVSSNGDEKLSEIDDNNDNDTQAKKDGDFRLKRMEKWVSELQNCGCFEETNDDEDNNNNKGFMLDRTSSSSPVVAKLDEMVSPSKEAVKKYLSSLSSTATFAQFVNRGLVVIPFLSAFAALKSLDLRGNAIASITGGSLPRGLHILNLSNNNISTIEGLRQLTRLRVLDLSYNRLLRVGHGLGSCSSLLELYLGGNKIGEVEGLHRLLKLNVLDLRFNKISATKCLRQLSANCNLQAINLEGNPVEKHVGDEHLKKYLQGLLPHLVFFNHQPMRVGALNHSADRPARLLTGSGGQHMRRDGTRSRGSSSHKLSSSSVYSRKSQSTPTAPLPKACKSRLRGRAPPKVTRTSSHYHHGCEVSKVSSFRANLYV